MGSPTYRATDGGLTFDAFYRDEWGVANTSANCEPKDAAARDGWHKNLFTTVKTTGGSVVEEPATFDEPFKNAADPNLNKGLKNKANPVPPSAKRDFTMSFYCSDDVTAYAKGLAGKPWTKPINLTVYFGVGSELNRHGIRSFFKNQANMQVFLQVEGIEKPQFGVAPTDMDIKRALGRFFKVDPIPYRVKVLAAFSTGSCGLNQALLNELIDVTSVERLVFYDCLYSQQCGNTATAIRMLKAKVGGNLKIVVYKASECANSFEEKPGVCPPGLRTKCGFIPPPGKCLDFNRLSVVVNNQGLIDPNGIIGNLFQNTSYIAMVVFRALQGAVDDGVIKLNPINAQALERHGGADGGLAPRADDLEQDLLQVRPRQRPRLRVHPLRGLVGDQQDGHQRVRQADRQRGDTGYLPGLALGKPPSRLGRGRRRGEA